MSGGDGKGHNSGSQTTGGVNGTSGKGGPSSGGGASDNSGFSSENNPWGGGNSGTIGGSQGGNGGNSGSGSNSNGNGNVVSRVVGDGMARSAAINPSIFTGYYLDSDGNVVGITSAVGGDAKNINLGPIKSYGGAGSNLGNKPNNSTFSYKDPVQAATENFNTTTQEAIRANKELQTKKNTLDAANQAVVKAQKEFDTAPSINPSLFPNQPSPKQFKHDILEKKKRERNDAQKEYDNASKKTDDINKILGEKKSELDQVKDAVSKIADFYSNLSKKFGEKFAKDAKNLAERSKGKFIRNYNQAINSFDKYKGNVNSKINAKDREAIARALESLNKAEMAKQLTKFGKAFGVVGDAIQWGGFFAGVEKGFRTKNWNDAFIAGEGIIASKVAAALVIALFSAMAIAPIGILGFAIIMAVIGALISDENLKSMNDFILSLK